MSEYRDFSDYYFLYGEDQYLGDSRQFVCLADRAFRYDLWFCECLDLPVLGARMDTLD